MHAENMNRENRHVDKWTAAGMVITAVYCLCRLSYSTAALTAATFGVLVIAASGVSAVIVTWFFGRPGKTVIWPVMTIFFSPFRIAEIRCPKESAKAIRISCYIILITWIQFDFHILTNYILHQRHAGTEGDWTALPFQLSLSLAAGWFFARQIALRDEWLWVRIIACLVIPAAFLSDVWLNGRLLFMESEDLADRVFYFTFLTFHFCIAALALFYNMNRKGAAE